MGGMVKDYLINPDEATQLFLNARNAVHMPDATHPSVVAHAQRERRKIRVTQLLGKIGKSQDKVTLDYLEIAMGDLDEDEARIFPAFPAFM